MSDSDPLASISTDDPALTRPEAAPPQAAAQSTLSLPSPARSEAPDGPLTLQTDLLGPLTLPDGAARAAELAELSRRAALYATRARGDGTRRAYDPDTIAMHVVRLADAGLEGHGGLAVSSIRVALAAMHRASAHRPRD